jgi:hypothetical protein
LALWSENWPPCYEGKRDVIALLRLVLAPDPDTQHARIVRLSLRMHRPFKNDRLLNGLEGL